MDIFTFFSDQIQNNQFASAALVAAPIAALTYTVRKIPLYLYRKIKQSLFLTITAQSGYNGYNEILHFVTDELIMDRFSKNFISSKVAVERVYNSSGNMNQDKSVFTRKLIIGYGFHFGLFEKVPVLVFRREPKFDQNSKVTESCRYSFLTRQKSVLERFNKALDIYTEEQRLKNDKLLIRTNVGKTWEKISSVNRRLANSVFLSNNADNLCISHVKEFISKSEWNKSRGLPNHTGILLYGPPGTCKTSLIQVIASETKRNINYLNLSSINNEEDFSSLLSTNEDWSRIILAIEDIDATSSDVGDRNNDSKSNKDSSISLSTLLNYLDGLMSPDGLVVIATTNHKDKIDPALLRKGRFDLQIEMEYCTKTEFEKMALFFEHDPSEYTLDYFHPMSGADLRSLLLEEGVNAVVKKQIELDTSYD